MPIITEWSRKESKALLDIMEKYCLQNNDIKLYRNPSKYQIIEKEMFSREFKKKNLAQIKRRWVTLKHQYYSVKKSNKTKSFQYFNELDRILGGQTSVDAINSGMDNSRIQDKRKYTWWTNHESHALLSIIQEYNCFQSNDDKVYTVEERCKIIEKEMVSRGFMTKTAKQIKVRWKYLKQRYASVKKTNQTEYFQYFNELDRILGGQTSVVTIDSGVDSVKIQGKRKKRKSWTNYETKSLLNIMQEYNCFQKIGGKVNVRKEKYKIIEKEMISRGFIKITDKRIYNHWVNLKFQYASAKQTNRTEYFQYFNELDRILGGSAQEVAKQKMIFWTHNETKALLNIMQKNNCYYNTDDKVNTLKQTYKMIEKEMISRGFMKTAKQIEARWVTLKSRHASVKETNRTKDFQYFNELDRILVGRRVVQGKRNKIWWTDDESQALLSIMQKYNCFQNTYDKMYTSEERYKIIEKEMVTRGCTKKTWKQIRIRWKNLKQKYDLANKTKRTEHFQYFNELDRILSGRTSVAAINSDVDSSKDDIVLKIEIDEDSPIVTRVQEVVQTKQQKKFPKNTNFKEMYRKSMDEVADNMTNTQKSFTRNLFKNQTKRIDNEFNIYEKNEEEFIESSINKLKEMLTNNTKVFLNNLSQILNQANSTHMDAKNNFTFITDKGYNV